MKLFLRNEFKRNFGFASHVNNGQWPEAAPYENERIIEVRRDGRTYLFPVLIQQDIETNEQFEFRAAAARMEEKR